MDFQIQAYVSNAGYYDFSLFRWTEVRLRFTEQIMPGCHKLLHGMEIAEGDGFIRWFEKDLQYLTGVIRDNDMKSMD